MNVLQRLTDCLREQRIRDLADRIKREPNRALARLLWHDMTREIRDRSPEQVARMEQGMRASP